jgi:hypothetical protein
LAFGTLDPVIIVDKDSFAFYVRFTGLMFTKGGHPQF